ncbi:hypothetical protein VTK26DRAFT_1246 [Humicola hyalothermophila]
MSVEIEPLELGFRRPFTVEVAQILKITNTNNAPVAFKVKTTAPKQYCVRPNSGRIEPGRHVEVSVLLQAMKQEPPLDAKCRDKFLVQSVTITSDLDFSPVSEIWDSVPKSAVQEKKIRVSWLPPADEGRLQPTATPSRQAAANGVEATPETVAAPAPFASPNQDTPASTQRQPEARSSPKPEPESTQPTSNTTSAALASSSASAAASALKSTTADTYDELKQQLAKAEATIASLKTEMASGLRQRKATAATGAAEPDAPTAGAAGQELAQSSRQATEGVPVQIVAVLCLASFLLAYFFF